MLAQNIKDFAVTTAKIDPDTTQVSDILGLVGFDGTNDAIVKYDGQNGLKYEAIRTSQNNAGMKQLELNGLEEEYLKKEEEYNDAFNN